MMENAWIIPLLPLLSFLLLLFFRQNKAAYIGAGLVFVSFILSLLVLFEQIGEGSIIREGKWLEIDQIVLTMGIEVNPLNALMLVIVSLVSLLVHIYSLGYMKGDERFSVFYSYLGLFTFSMLGLVLSPNLLQLYIFWELVGVCSFLLIGFYFYNPEARAAAKKAFIVTRIGDVGLFIGMLLLFWQVGSFEFDVIFAALERGVIPEGMITLIAILVFIGAVGKSGQFPLHTWLPDAMEGPTPVSALIHAATMVAAGVYLVAAVYPLYLASETAMTVVAVVGAFTAIFAASIGLVQRDIKRILAYSTVSQLGYMMLALGVGGYVAAIFHLMTHAFFKALLFLGAGSVIHAAQTKDIEEMGGLWKKMKLTGPLFLIGSLAISGFPLFSGFFSKDEILASAVANGSYGLFTVALIAAFFTAFYMFRMFFLVFTGEERNKKHPVHESPSVMVLPMLVLGVLAVVSGYVQTPFFHGLGDWLNEGPFTIPELHHGGGIWVPIAATVVSLGGIFLAWLMYGKKILARDWLSSYMPFLYNLLFNKYYVDETYRGTFVTWTRVVSYFCLYVERFLVEGIVSIVSEFTKGTGKAVSRFQSGQVQGYTAAAFAGIVILIVVIALRGGYFQ
jgi:NADH-quinone oxidoreductase subunit L